MSKLLPFWDDIEWVREEGFVGLGVSFSLVAGEGYFDEVSAFFRALPLYVEWLGAFAIDEIQPQDKGSLMALDYEVFCREFQRGVRRLSKVLQREIPFPLTLSIFTPSLVLLFSLTFLGETEEEKEGKSFKIYFFRLELELMALPLLKTTLTFKNLANLASGLPDELKHYLFEERVLTKIKPSGVVKVKTGSKERRVLRRFSKVEALKRWALYWCYQDFFGRRRRAHNLENLRVFGRALRRLFGFIESSSPETLTLQQIEERWREFVKDGARDDKERAKCFICGRALRPTERGSLCGSCFSYKSSLRKIIEVAEKYRLTAKLLRGVLTPEELECISSVLKRQGFQRSVSRLLERAHKELRFRKLLTLVVTSEYPQYSALL